MCWIHSKTLLISASACHCSIDRLISNVDVTGTDEPCSHPEEREANEALFTGKNNAAIKGME